MDNTMGKTKRLWAFFVELQDEVDGKRKPKFVHTVCTVEDMSKSIQEWYIRMYKPKIRSCRMLSLAIVNYIRTYADWWKEVEIIYNKENISQNKG